jgi:Uma2 family endonuclease
MLAARKKQQTYSYADYLTWDDNERWELINGVAYNMSHAPSRRHQLISSELYVQIKNFLEKTQSRCEAYYAPFDVRFPEGAHDDEIIDAVQPDIVVVCDSDKLDEKGCQGAPDFIVEILSPSTEHKDCVIKRSLYEKNRVKEYWIIDPSNNLVTVYQLDEFGYGKPSIYAGKDRLSVKTLHGLEIDLDKVFRGYDGKRNPEKNPEVKTSG